MHSDYPVNCVEVIITVIMETFAQDHGPLKSLVTMVTHEYWLKCHIPDVNDWKLLMPVKSSGEADS